MKNARKKQRVGPCFFDDYSITEGMKKSGCLFHPISEGVAEVDADESADGAPEDRGDGEDTAAPQGGNITADGASNEKKQEYESFGHRMASDTIRDECCV